MMSANQMAIHTTDGCLTSNQIQQSGELGADDCASNSGCTVKELKPNSYGDDFNNAGGGWYAVERTDTFIKVWFWNREVPGTPSDVLKGYRGALYMGTGLAGLGLAISIVFLAKTYWDDHKKQHREIDAERKSAHSSVAD